MKYGLLKLLIFILLVIGFIVLSKHYHFTSYLSLAGFNHFHNQIIVIQDLNKELFVFGYVALYLLMITCCIPGTIVFDLLAGFLFGVFWGSLIVIFSYTIGSIINFLMIKYIFQDLFKRRFTRFKSLVNLENKSNVLLSLIGLRLVPILPFWLLNIAAVLFEVRLSVFIFTTFVGIVPSSIIYVLLGDGVRDEVAQNKDLTMAMIMNPQIWLPVFCMAFLLLIPSVIRFIKNKISKK